MITTTATSSKPDVAVSELMPAEPANDDDVLEAEADVVETTDVVEAVDEVLEATDEVLDAIGSQALGILLSSFMRRAEQAVHLLPFIVLPALTVKGSITALNAMPTWLQPLSYFLPLTYATDALRDVLIKGWSLGQSWM